jgi:hypothetical protein
MTRYAGPWYSDQPSSHASYFGAEGWPADDTAALNAYAEYCAKHGWDFRLTQPHRVTDTIRFGPSIYSDYSKIAARDTTPGYDRDDYLNSGSLKAARSYIGCNIIGESSAMLIADFAGSATPVLEYNCYSGIRRHSLYGSLVICDISHAPGGRLIDPGTGAIPSNGLIGCVINYPSMNLVSGLNLRGMQVAGLLSVIPYWTKFTSNEAYACGDAFSFEEINAGSFDNLKAAYCKRGILFNGAGWHGVAPSTEQCETDIRLTQSDVGVLTGGAYLEDVSRADGTGKAAVDIGGWETTILVSDSSAYRVGQEVTGTVSGAAGVIGHINAAGPNTLGIRLRADLSFSTSDQAFVSGGASRAVSYVGARKLKVISTRFEGIRVGDVRPNKIAFRCAGVDSNSVFSQCRQYSHGVVADGLTGPPVIDHCDWTSWT